MQCLISPQGFPKFSPSSPSSPKSFQKFPNSCHIVLKNSPWILPRSILWRNRMIVMLWLFLIGRKILNWLFFISLINISLAFRLLRHIIFGLEKRLWSKNLSVSSLPFWYLYCLRFFWWHQGLVENSWIPCLNLFISRVQRCCQYWSYIHTSASPLFNV